jgi:hypothetical protein
MAIATLRRSIGRTVDLVTDLRTFHGTLLSCSTASVWLLSDGDTDVIVPLARVRNVVVGAVVVGALADALADAA